MQLFETGTGMEELQYEIGGSPSPVRRAKCWSIWTKHRQVVEGLEMGQWVKFTLSSKKTALALRSHLKSSFDKSEIKLNTRVKEENGHGVCWARKTQREGK